MAEEQADHIDISMQDKYALFTPHFMVRKCSYNADSTECTTNCINNGRYCAVDSIDDAFSRKFQGWQVSRLQAQQESCLSQFSHFHRMVPMTDVSLMSL